MSTLKKLAGQTAVYGLSSIVGRFLNVLLVPIYTRVFVPAEYGVVTEMYAYVTFLNILFTYGLETAFFRFYQQAENKEKVFSTAFLSILISSISLATLLILFASPLSDWLSGEGRPTLPSKYISWFAVIIAADAITAIPFALLRQQNKALRFAMLRMAGIVVNVLLNVFFLFYCPAVLKSNPDSWVSAIYNPSFGVGYVFAINVVTSLLTLALLLPGTLRIRLRLDSVLWKEMIRYAMPLMIAGFAGMVNESIDRLMIPRLVADKASAMEQLGIYGACYKLSIIMTLFVQTFRFAAEPFFFSQSTKENARQLYATVMHYFVLFCAFIFLGVMLYIDIIKHFIGPDYHSGLRIVPILLMANLCLGVYFNLSIWYKLSGKTHWGAWLSMIGAGITLLLNFLLIPLFGYVGAAWTTLACYAGMMVISWYVGQKSYPVPYNISSFFVFLVSALACYLLSEGIRSITGFSEGWMMFVNTLLLLAYAAGLFLYEKPKNDYLRMLFQRKHAGKDHQ